MKEKHPPPPIALAATDGNERTTHFNNTSSAGKNGTFMQTAVAGATNAVNGGIDYLNGAGSYDGYLTKDSTGKELIAGFVNEGRFTRLYRHQRSSVYKI